MAQDRIEKSFTVSSPARLQLSNICGSVEIRRGEDGLIRVTAIKQTHSGDAERTEIEMSQESGGKVTVTTRFPDGAWSWIFGSHPCCVDYVVTAPRRCSLNLNGVSCTLDVEAFEGEFRVKSVSGEITLRDLSGSLQLYTVSGDVRGERLSGALDLDTVSADVALAACDLPAVKANTISGNVDLKTPLGSGPYTFNSVSGDVHLTLPVDSRCTVELHSVSGDITTAFPVSSSAQTLGSHTVAVQGGGVLLSMHSVSGDVSLDGEGGVPPAAGGNQGLSAEQRREVLERIERGELTVEEALTRLQG
jgi:hypothetical protein